VVFHNSIFVIFLFIGNIFEGINHHHIKNFQNCYYLLSHYGTWYYSAMIISILIFTNILDQYFSTYEWSDHDACIKTKIHLCHKIKWVMIRIYFLKLNSIQLKFQ
jgi:hypothetical protein